MTRRDKAILALICAAEIISCAKVGVLKSRITDLETQRDIYASRARHWINRALEDEEVIDSMQLRLDALADGKVELEDAGVFFCTAYCTEQYPHICGEGHGVTASGQKLMQENGPADTGGRNRGGGSVNLPVWNSFVH